MARFAAVIVVALSIAAVSYAAPSKKVEASLIQAYAKNAAHTASIVVAFDGNSKVLKQMSAQTFATRGEKLTVQRQNLIAHAAKSQANALALLSRYPLASAKSYWANNKLFVKNAPASLVSALAALEEVTEVRAEKMLHLIQPTEAHEASPIQTFAEWGLVNIKAPEAWAAGFTGEGVRIATVDTGARGTHVELVDNFVGDYGWFDPYKGTAAPGDGVGHGTHTTANIAGKEVGVAPGAQWMACKGCEAAGCTEEALVGCGQWVACPTLADGSAEDCSQAADLSSNSWGGGQGDPFYNEIIDLWHSSGITPIFANGNSGPTCGTANSPADQNVIAVGSTNNANTASVFSSKGPSVDGALKPDVCAPGTDVRSAYYTSNTAYFTMSGTSMACPHAAGVVALMKGAYPDISYDQIYNILISNNDRDLVPTQRNCGNIDTSTFPNNSYGYGKVNALKAAQAAKALAGKA